MTQLSPLIPLIFIIPLIAFWLWMFNDMLKSDYLPGLMTNDAKLDWMVAFILFNVFAAVVYYALVYRQRH
jgi:cbb3-type cytochrome oxidase subunit 3